jgi:hypothetical protein
MHRRRLPSLLLLLCLASSVASAVGCSVKARADRQPLELEGPVSVEVNSFAGDVSIRSFDPRTGGRAHVTVVGEALHAINRRGDAESALESIDWSATIEHDDRGPRLVVNATTSDDEAHILRAHVTVHVPTVDGATVRTTRGDVELNELTGPVDVRTTDGTVELMSDQPLRSPISIFTSDGDVNVRLAPGTSGDFNLYAEHGSIRMRIKSGQMAVAGSTSGDTFHGQLNEGTSPIIIRTTDGVIRFTVKPNPKKHGILHLP